MVATCKLCGELLGSKRSDRKARACTQKAAVVPAGCWLQHEPSLKRLCALSLACNPVDRFAERAEAFRTVGEASLASDLHLRTALATLSDVQRYDLMRHAVPELKVKLSPLLIDLDVRTLQRPDSPVEIPQDIAEALQRGLNELLDRLKRRVATVQRRGGGRNPEYLRKRMDAPIRLAKYLDEQGITSWDAMQKRDVHRFLAENEGVRPSHLTRLMRALTEGKPFAEHRGKYVRGAASKALKPLQAVLLPDEIEAFLAEVRSRCSDAEYVGAWLVAKLGMTAKAAHGLTADRLRVDESGRTVIRPAQCWVVLPRTIAALIGQIADQSAPGWRDAKGAELAFVGVFRGVLPKLNLFSTCTLSGKSRLLRASAVYARLLAGNLDRVTLHETMGVSHSTITSIERHLSVDLHRKLDPEFVKARNQVLTGDA